MHIRSSDVGRSVLLAAIVSAIATAYVSSSRTFYYWDYAHYQYLTEAATETFRISILFALGKTFESVELDYNWYFTLPLVPIFLNIPLSRLAFVLALSLVYFVPLTLAAGGVATKLLRGRPREAFWFVAFLTLFIPAAWVPTLLGRPDVGAACLMTLAVFVYVGDFNLERFWRIAAIGALVAAATLFRRHFLYSGIAFFVSAALHATWRITSDTSSEDRWRRLFRAVIRLALVGFFVLVTLALFGRPFIQLLLKNDFHALYESYTVTVRHGLLYFGIAYSWPIWILASLGIVLGIRTGATDRAVTSFVALFGIVSLLLWVIAARQIDEHYVFHVLLLVVMGLAALGWTLWRSLKGRLRQSALALATLYLGATLFAGIGRAEFLRPYQGLLPQNRGPAVRADYDEILRLVSYLRSITSPEDSIYVAGTTVLFNDDVVRRAEIEEFGARDKRLNLPVVPHIDSRDSYPLEGILRARYVIIQTPFGRHTVAPQLIVNAVHDAFVDNWEIARDFTRLPSTFQLADKRTVLIYQRVRPTSTTDALRFFVRLRDYIGPRPGGQLDWQSLNQDTRSVVRLVNGNEVEILAAVNAGAPSKSFLYAGRSPLTGTVSGQIAFSGDGCDGTDIRAVALDDNWAPAGEQRLQPSPSSALPPSFSFSARSSPFFLLSVHQTTPSINSCVLLLDLVTDTTSSSP